MATALNSAIHTIAMIRTRSCPRTQAYVARRITNFVESSIAGIETSEIHGAGQRIYGDPPDPRKPVAGDAVDVHVSV